MKEEEEEEEEKEEGEEEEKKKRRKRKKTVYHCDMASPHIIINNIGLRLEVKIIHYFWSHQ